MGNSAAYRSAHLRHPEGIAALQARMADTGETAVPRIVLARVLTDVCAPHVAEAMTELVRDDLPLDVRSKALAVLTSLARTTPRATALLAVAAAEPGLPAELRIEAAGGLPNRAEQEQALLAAAEAPAARRRTAGAERGVDVRMGMEGPHRAGLVGDATRRAAPHGRACGEADAPG
ncbi:hypothetical protein C9F11_03720 [Streptomyces sp. YIM 121038]|uniref:hypothetical protein n=1 Tax=Streptomyces sp. YIM 121038 TaxID=2136401 RepID=UPI0011105460|nr:hypothetical protein [Streptomyces sp. YIM 121038]QCX74447.1 hypothetical protein C9F11_03720 [Streptomyces sp. YIM 121038]